MLNLSCWRAILSQRVLLCAQVVDLYWGVDPEEWDSPELQRLRMKLLEECLKTSAGPCFVVSTNMTGSSHGREKLATKERAAGLFLHQNVGCKTSFSCSITTLRWSDTAEIF